MSIQWTNEQIDKIIYEYTENQLSLEKIAQLFKVSRGAIKTVLKHNNIAIRTVQQTNTTKKHLTEEEINKIIYNYTVLHQGLQTCGKEFGYSQYLVEKLLKERNIKKRNYTESKQCGRKYKINDGYFKKQSSNMAYILGLLASDGNVLEKENRITLELQSQDIEILRKINNELSNEREIKTYTTSKNKNYCKLQIWSSEIKKDLSVYNIVPNKTFTLQPPLFLDKKYYIDFIRGYFDGDGCIYKRENNREIVQIDGASKAMMEWIRNVFNDYGITTPSFRTYRLETGVKMYRLSYYNQEIIHKIYKLFYHSENLLYLERKKQKFSQETLLPKK